MKRGGAARKSSSTLPAASGRTNGSLALNDDEIYSSDEESSGGEQTQRHSKRQKKNEEDAEESARTETAEEKRIRLAKQYLSRLEAMEREREGDEDEPEDGADYGTIQQRISSRLKEDTLATKGYLGSQFSSLIEQKLESVDMTVMKGHQVRG